MIQMYKDFCEAPLRWEEAEGAMSGTHRKHTRV
jgi:hypothetical protein